MYLDNITGSTYHASYASVSFDLKQLEVIARINQASNGALTITNQRDNVTKSDVNSEEVYNITATKTVFDEVINMSATVKVGGERGVSLSHLSCNKQVTLPGERLVGKAEFYFKRYRPGSSNIDILSYTDYYPFGSAIPERRYVASGKPYRFGYQGQFAEEDNETGYNSFELRLYDSRIGRWMVPDPYRQYWSPYLGMGNNPINGVDPDGGLFGGGDPPNEVYELGDITSTVHEISEVVVTPKPFSVEVDGLMYTFWKGNNSLELMGLKEMWSPENSIANYAYYLNNKEKFGDAKFSDMFVSDHQRRVYCAEDALLEATEILTRGNGASDAIDFFHEDRRSKYANLFPANKDEFTPTLQQRREYRLYQIEKNMSAVHRSPEFSYWAEKYENTMLLFNE